MNLKVFFQGINTDITNVKPHINDYGTLELYDQDGKQVAVITAPFAFIVLPESDKKVEEQ